MRLSIPNAEVKLCNLPLAHRDGSSTARDPAVKLPGDFAGREHAWQDRIVRRAGEIDLRTRMVNAIHEAQDPYARGRNSSGPPLAVGMFVQGMRVRRVMPVPRTAVHEGDIVYLVDSGGLLRLRRVDVLRRKRDVGLIRAGIEEWERICVSPLETAIDGMAVEVGESPDPSSPEPAPGAGA